MKKIALIISLVTPILGFSQYSEFKVNPIGILWNSPDLSFETGLSDKFALEGVLSARYGSAGTGSSVSVGGTTISEPKQKGIGLILVGKFLNPFDLAGFNQNTYYGLFTRYNRLLIYDNQNEYFPDYRRVVGSVGFVYGYKYLFTNNWVLDFGFGFGRAFLESNEFINNVGSPAVSFKTGIDFYSRFLIGKRF
jgi:hypothetical protein